jgi:beta-lactamase class A
MPPAEIKKKSSRRRVAAGSPREKLLTKLLRVVLVTIGVSGTIGTTIAIFRQPSPPPVSRATPPVTPIVLPANTIVLKSENRLLTEQLAAAAAKQPKLKATAFFIDLSTGTYAALDGDRPIQSASTIKIPIAMALMVDLDRAKLKKNDLLKITKTAIAAGAGDLQSRPVGSSVTIDEALTKMLAQSDNTATNILIDRLGGNSALNSRWQEWGFIGTKLVKPLPDFGGSNQTTAREMAQMMAAIAKGKILTPAARDRLLTIARQTTRNTMLPQGLGTGATIAHKTGSINSVVGDVGYIVTPRGKEYIAAVFVNHPNDAAKAEALVREFSRLAYSGFDR